MIIPFYLFFRWIFFIPPLKCRYLFYCVATFKWNYGNVFEYIFLINTLVPLYNTIIFLKKLTFKKFVDLKFRNKKFSPQTTIWDSNQILWINYNKFKIRSSHPFHPTHNTIFLIQFATKILVKSRNRYLLNRFDDKFISFFVRC